MKVKSNIQLFAVLFPSFIFILAVSFMQFLPPDTCIDQSVSSRGFGSDVKQFAELNAIRNWETRAKNIHTDLTGWHRAQEKNMSCRIVKKGNFYFCRAFAKPCLSTLANNQNIDLDALTPKSSFPMFRKSK